MSTYKQAPSTSRNFVRASGLFYIFLGSSSGLNLWFKIHMSGNVIILKLIFFFFFFSFKEYGSDAWYSSFMIVRSYLSFVLIRFVAWYIPEGFVITPLASMVHSKWHSIFPLPFLIQSIMTSKFRDQWECVTSFDADPDIAGPGVSSSMNFHHICPLFNEF